jgi:hypothetical protein
MIVAVDFQKKQCCAADGKQERPEQVPRKLEDV